MISAVKHRDKTTIISLEGTLSVGQQDSLKEELLKNIPSETSNIVLDFTKVAFIDSACLGALVALARRLRSKGGDIRLCELVDDVSSIFQITRLDKVLKLFESLDDAVASYSSE